MKKRRERRVELLPPFSYLHGLSDRIRNADGGGDGDGKTKASVKAGSCSISIASGGPEETRTPDLYSAIVALSQLSYRPS
jgi:hypothetical protein